MKNIIKKNNYPKIRFKEFSSQWLENSFGDIYKFQRTNSLSRANLNYKTGDIKNLHYGDIHKKLNILFDVKKENVPYINQDILINKIPEEDYCQKGDLLIADASEDYADIGKAIEIINTNNEKLVGGLHTHLARPEKETIAHGFSGCLMQTNKVRKSIMKMATGVSVLGISKTNLSKIKINLPSLPEQTKIATFLTTVDKKINLLEEKKEKLEEYKKGMMQKLFYREIGFKGNFYDWEVLRLGEVFEERSERKNGKTELLSVTMNNGVVKRSDIEGKDNSSTDKSNYKKVEAGDIAYNSMRMWQGASGVSKYTGIVSPAYTVLKPQTGMNIDFFGYFFKTTKMKQTFQKNSQGLTSDTWNLKFPLLSRIKVMIPSEEEQQKIADFLSALDEKISFVEREIDMVKEWKKGLLMGMFI